MTDVAVKSKQTQRASAKTKKSSGLTKPRIFTEDPGAEARRHARKREGKTR